MLRLKTQEFGDVTVCKSASLILREQRKKEKDASVPEEDMSHCFSTKAVGRGSKETVENDAHILINKHKSLDYAIIYLHMSS